MGNKTQAPEEDSPEDRVAIHRIHDIHKSVSHVGQLLEIATHCSKQLWWAAEPAASVDVDPILRKEAGKTYELVHSRLRDLIDEQKRWSLEPTKSEEESSDLIDATMELYDEKVKQAQNQNRPSIFLKTKLGKFQTVDGMEWIIWVGENNIPLNRDLHASGKSVKDAMENFDKAYEIAVLIRDPAVVATETPSKETPPALGEKPKKNAKPRKPKSPKS